MGLYRQMIGRVLRPAADKTDAIILDHSGAVFRHGFVEDRVEWTLDPDKRPKVRPKQRVLRALRRGSGMPTMRRRPHRRRAVLELRISAAAAAARGLISRWRSRTRKRTSTPNGTATSERTRPLARDADLYRRERGLQTGLGRAQIQRKIRCVSRVGRLASTNSADAEVRSWVRSRQIAYAKRRVA